MTGVTAYRAVTAHLSSKGGTWGWWTGGPAWDLPPYLLTRPSHGSQTRARTTGQPATHRTPSFRLKSSWSGSPLRWKTAITPLWMLRGVVEGERRVDNQRP